MMKDVAISPCRPSELDEVTALVNASYRGPSARAGWTHEEDWIEGPRTTRAALEAELADADRASIFCLREAPSQELLGCVLLESISAAEPSCYIGMLTVRPDLQDSGLGRRMLEYAENEARRWGAGLARIRVLSIRDSLIAWYERRGYHRTGAIEPFPYGDRSLGSPTRPDLEFVVLEKPLKG